MCIVWMGGRKEGWRMISGGRERRKRNREWWKNVRRKCMGVIGEMW